MLATMILEDSKGEDVLGRVAERDTNGEKEIQKRRREKFIIIIFFF